MTQIYTAIVSFELAKKLKEKGFPQLNSIKHFYTGSGQLAIGLYGEDHYSAPTIAEVLDWLLAKGYEIHPLCDNFPKIQYYCTLYAPRTAETPIDCRSEANFSSTFGGIFASLSEALEWGIDMALDLMTTNS